MKFGRFLLKCLVFSWNKSELYYEKLLISLFLSLFTIVSLLALVIFVFSSVIYNYIVPTLYINLVTPNVCLNPEHDNVRIVS